MFAPDLFAQRLATRISRKLGHNPADERIAAEVVVISPDEMGERAPAFALPGQLDRVKATPPDTSMANELARIGGGEILHDATVALLLRDVQYFDGFIYTRGARRQQVVRPEPLTSAGPIEAVKECSLPGTSVGDQFFGHFLIDDSSTALLAPRFAPPRLPRATARHAWSHAAPYRAQLGIDIPQIGRARIDRAWLFRDHGMTADRRARMAELRTRMRAAGGPRQGHGAFILRSGGQARHLLNEAEIADRLAREGFEIVDPARDSVAQIATKLHGAAIIASVEGSAFAHGLLSMAEGSALVAIQPPFRFNNPWKDYTDALGMRYGYVIATGGQSEFRLDPDNLMRTLDLAKV
ncbi:glycosyltransferase family 61 protein [Paracoccus laeviglucosivorans]|uniref:Capsular polysaccharide biosynthesis protein n=1 Tax=Paracoccus laeviglucosivorans TaxID=1197861 RepID=A0A521FFT1_9RHOB|nr:glycosyltransferase family 61 protein [Paracoccus laeviglucosivorans]SMO95058.1 Capsular polysaccharide biosynthesis protein [Paracoccus laeviglucosivorans]